MREPQFLAELESYRAEAAKTIEENPPIALLPPTLDESLILHGIRELDALQGSLQTDVENLYKCMKFLNKVTHQHIRDIRDHVMVVKEDFDDRIKEEEEVVTPKIRQLKDDYDFRMNSLAKYFEKHHLPVQQQKAKLEKSKEQALARIEQYKLEAKTHADKGQHAAEHRWKEKANKTRKELSEIENQLKQVEKALKDLEEKRSVEVIGLREDLENKVKEARKDLVELEASRDAKVLIHQQEMDKMETQTKAIIDQISKIIKLLENTLVQFTKLGVKKELGQERSLLCYVPFYVVCYTVETKKRYTIFPPSVVSTVGVFTKLKGVLGMAKIKGLLVPRFKTFTALVNSVQALAEKNAAFEAEMRELGDENNLLNSNLLREDIRRGLGYLKSEGWFSDKEFSATEQEISKLS
jgi:hypothetical protein